MSSMTVLFSSFVVRPESPVILPILLSGAVVFPKTSWFSVPVGDRSCRATDSLYAWQRSFVSIMRWFGYSRFVKYYIKYKIYLYKQSGGRSR